MMSLFLALHKVAAQRGDGLRPELLRLLEHSKAAEEAAKRALKIVEQSNLLAPNRDGRASQSINRGPARSRCCN
jgi:hypothetical protein